MTHIAQQFNSEIFVCLERCYDVMRTKNYQKNTIYQNNNNFYSWQYVIICIVDYNITNSSRMGVWVCMNVTLNYNQLLPLHELSTSNTVIRFDKI